MVMKREDINAMASEHTSKDFLNQLGEGLGKLVFPGNPYEKMKGPMGTDSGLVAVPVIAGSEIIGEYGIVSGPNGVKELYYLGPHPLVDKGRTIIELSCYRENARTVSFGHNGASAGLLPFYKRRDGYKGVDFPCQGKNDKDNLLSRMI